MSDLKDMQHQPRRRGGFMAGLRASFLTGLVVILPFGLTIWVIWWAVGWVDGFVWPLIPTAYTPEVLINRWLGHPDPANPDHITVNVRGVGLVLFLIFTVIIGWAAKGIIGRSLLAWGESMVERMPVVRSIYNGLKQIAETVFTEGGATFDRSCLVEFPCKGLWSIGFVSGKGKGELAVSPETGEVLYSVFLATTPNPTSGYLIYVPESQVHWLKMSVEDSAKLIISGGLVYPSANYGMPPTLPGEADDTPKPDHP